MSGRASHCPRGNSNSICARRLGRARWHPLAWAAVASLSLGFGGNAVAGGDPDRGAQISTVCQACHGSNGISTDPQVPKLAGQHQDYLAQALAAYNSGQRSNPIMATFAKPLSREDREDLAAFYASQSGVETPHATH